MKKVFDIDESDFVTAVGRPPKNNDELEKFCHAIDNGIDAQLDWDILYECAKNEVIRNEKV